MEEAFKDAYDNVLNDIEDYNKNTDYADIAMHPQIYDGNPQEDVLWTNVN